MEKSEKQPLDPKQTFRDCGTCSQTFGHLLNHEFGNEMDVEEKALDPLAGGINNLGHQCGMLWGASLAIGAEANKLYDNEADATAAAVTATQEVVKSFSERSNTVNCREIIGQDISNIVGLVKFGLKTMLTGMNNSLCFNLAEAWAPEAIDAAKEGLSTKPIELTHEPRSCASETVKQLGGTDEESIMVAGYAGGLGLSGKACGALSAAIWFNTLKWCNDNPGKNPKMINNPIAKELIKKFQKVTDSKMLCSEITGRQFDSIEEHSNYIKEGGCKHIMEALAE